ncbi:hypothetical protein Agabi119p4_9964 [Agaricus bisporus var. burnettii]|uniref:Uncharacterized protein n=1 Tax=Agaricus bisporus var. burnettii TaxID=192524 RepID=A0A8H7C3T1_AGABI|nr:hypothetical protein Agabi119p4_9964 [Agaricus bisporus var. burnettii]
MCSLATSSFRSKFHYPSPSTPSSLQRPYHRCFLHPSSATTSVISFLRSPTNPTTKWSVPMVPRAITNESSTGGALASTEFTRDGHKWLLDLHSGQVDATSSVHQGDSDKVQEHNNILVACLKTA